MYTDGCEILNDQVVNNFINRHSFLISKAPIETEYKNEYYTFMDNSIVTYSGRNSLWDTIFYEKEGELLLLKTEKLIHAGNIFDYTSFMCDILSWKADSINYVIEGPADYSVYANKMKYKFVDNKIQIPILGYYYKNGNASLTFIKEDELNYDVINYLTNDTLAIIEYRLILCEK